MSGRSHFGVKYPIEINDKFDIASASGAEQQAGDVRRLLNVRGPQPGTPGEVRWNKSLGGGIHALLHQDMPDELQGAMIAAEVAEVVQRYEQDLEATVTEVRTDGDTYHARVKLRSRAGELPAVELGVER